MTSTIDLSNLCVLVSVNTHKPQMTKQSRKGTKAAEDALNAKKAGKYTMNLYPDTLIQPIRQAEENLRRLVRAYSIPLNRNEYLVPKQFRQTLYDLAEPIFTTHKLAVEAATINYAAVLHAAAEQQGGMHDEATYPDATDFKAEFELYLTWKPGYAVHALAVDEIGETLAQQLEVQQANALMDGTRKLIGEMAKLIGTMADKLRRKLDEELREGKKSPRFHDSLMENLNHLVDVLPELNFTNDPRVTQIVNEVRDRLSIPIEVLKNGTPTIQERVLSDCDDILKKMKAFGF
jgi:hypothetical protein